MSSRSAALSLAFANVGHLFTHLLMLLYPTVVLALEGRYGLSYGELLALSLPGFVLYGVAALPAPIAAGGVAPVGALAATVVRPCPYQKPCTH